MTKLYELRAECCMWHLPPINNTPSRPLDLEISKSLLIVSQRNFIAIYNLLPTHYYPSVLTYSQWTHWTHIYQTWDHIVCMFYAIPYPYVMYCKVIGCYFGFSPLPHHCNKDVLDILQKWQGFSFPSYHGQMNHNTTDILHFKLMASCHFSSSHNKLTIPPSLCH